MSKYIFITGGVMSGIGKGIATASLGKILQSKGFEVTAIKIDPYINIDAGTMNPIEHGEVFVTDDGLETDQDIGHYERFLDRNMTADNYMTTGQVYETVIHKERNLEYGGKCVEVVPHIPEEVMRRIYRVSHQSKAEFVLIEIGGTVGEYQNMLFLEAARMLKLRHPKDVLFILVSYLPVPQIIGEMKTKPTQYATRTLNSAGIQPDIIIARSEFSLDEPRKRKISVFCNVAPEDVISAPDIESIYEVPLNFEKDNLSQRILSKFNLRAKKKDFREWRNLVKVIKNNSQKINIGIVGKYFATGNFTLSDSYISIIEAVKHAGWHFHRKPNIKWLNSEEYEKNSQKIKELRELDGLIVPGGYGERGVEGKIKAIEFARKNKIPYLGLCYGMQLAVIEFARNVCKMNMAHTTEINPNTKHPVIDLMSEQKAKIQKKDYGGSMRLGAYLCQIAKGTRVQKAYGQTNISERHRHRYEVNNDFRLDLEKRGLVIAGLNPQRNLVEIIELKNHPFFIATQFHPEFKSRPLRPHPLFREFVKAGLK
ncbi:MAG: CTP synthase [Candidatus Portnoybacteria bacterium RIFCSPLOWO2_12_FULL_39_9]|uniref:CTP synthase n=1 Tax=Candidatus Portnoybacteria bacterium RIFCSPHIGHO2_12_FULL_38_9 TaxID=1801997 RepID=A0A1G2FE00_9BACT|nr:MAG: CTP synthase [Candidatus Portnoybacteria bacterium RBG_13_40_8]OGZ35641.1 MAG: CTP synthase [Candidatus Portnoybacteria bacterium RIFCSPHIGHO2_02_FULL_39_12]OGZ36294.1 MAG: CTP synthase [Candidatus Portnoybacteria bacterium RIFCSPHIGHO2_12_FULL_38_9]OGZ40758.1 MAG: CTP synthase [Candidatus Portnoybacteria bacterium RIFCSPLOWO2_12_FULL_39_9]